MIHKFTVRRWQLLFLSLALIALMLGIGSGGAAAGQ